MDSIDIWIPLILPICLDWTLGCELHPIMDTEVSTLFFYTHIFDT
jgi:hypothetical protein